MSNVAVQRLMDQGADYEWASGAVSRARKGHTATDIAHWLVAYQGAWQHVAQDIGERSVELVRIEQGDGDCTELHTPAPAGLDAWAEWSARKKETHRLSKCPRCGLFKVWMEKKQVTTR